MSFQCKVELVSVQDLLNKHEADTLAVFLGAEKGPEKVVSNFIGDAMPHIFDDDVIGSVLLAGLQGHAPVTANGLHGVLDDIDKDLFHLALIDVQGRKVGIRMPCDVNSPLFALAAKQIDAFSQDGQYILLLAFRVGQPDDIRVFLHEFV